MEVKSTIDTNDVDYFKSRINGAKTGLKNHIVNYKDAEYGVAVAIAFDPHHVVAGEIYPKGIGNEKTGKFENPYIECFTKEEIMKWKVEEGGGK
ncbi:MAG: hypothetical protein QXU11_00660 [Thermoproteota archaeon]